MYNSDSNKNRFHIGACDYTAYKATMWKVELHFSQQQQQQKQTNAFYRYIPGFA